MFSQTKQKSQDSKNVANNRCQICYSYPYDHGVASAMRPIKVASGSIKINVFKGICIRKIKLLFLNTMTLKVCVYYLNFTRIHTATHLFHVVNVIPPHFNRNPICTLFSLVFFSCSCPHNLFIRLCRILRNFLIISNHITYSSLAAKFSMKGFYCTKGNFISSKTF